MAKPSKPRDSSYEAMSNGSNSSEDEQINDQINEDDEEELEAVARSAGTDEDNSPASDGEAVTEAEDIEEISEEAALDPASQTSTPMVARLVLEHQMLHPIKQQVPNLDEDKKPDLMGSKKKRTYKEGHAEFLRLFDLALEADDDKEFERLLTKAVEAHGVVSEPLAASCDRIEEGCNPATHNSLTQKCTDKEDHAEFLRLFDLPLEADDDKEFERLLTKAVEADGVVFEPLGASCDRTEEGCNPATHNSLTQKRTDKEDHAEFLRLFDLALEADDDKEFERLLTKAVKAHGVVFEPLGASCDRTEEGCNPAC